MDKKTYLCRYHNILELIERKKEYIAFCNERSSSIPGQDFTQPRVDHTPSYEAPFVKWILKASDAEAELKKLEEKAIRVKAEIEATIATVNNEELEMILNYRYIDWLSWDEICVKVYCSQASIYRKHREALEKLHIKK